MNAGEMGVGCNPGYEVKDPPLACMQASVPFTEYFIRASVFENSVELDFLFQHHAVFSKVLERKNYEYVEKSSDRVYWKVVKIRHYGEEFMAGAKEAVRLKCLPKIYSRILGVDEFFDEIEKLTVVSDVILR